jgi:soluble lytic murein transglycosylase-like protein
MTFGFFVPRVRPYNFRTRKTSFLTFITAFAFAGAFSIFNCAQAPTSYAQAKNRTAIVVSENNSPRSGNLSLDEIIERAGARHGVDPRLIHAVIWRESNYRNDVTSPRGAAGLMQLMPATARRFGCQNSRNPEANVEAGTRLLRYLLIRFDGNVRLALAGYNAGEGNVDRYNGVPPFNETQQYVRLVIERYGRTHHPVRGVESNSETRSGNDVARLAERDMDRTN